MPLFIHSLKKAKIIDSYLFYFNFNIGENNNDIIGYLILGNVTEDIENIEIKQFSTVFKYGFPYWGITFNQISVGIDDYIYNISRQNNFQRFDMNDVELVASLPYIVGTYDYNIYIKFHFFYDLLSKNICKYTKIPINPNYSTFVCDGNQVYF